MDTNILLVTGTLLALAFALPGTILSLLQLKDRWGKPHDGNNGD